MRHLVTTALVLSVGSALAGCRGYVLQGKVIRGFTDAMSVVSADDDRFGEAGVPNVKVTVHRDPDRLAIHLAGSGLSDSTGAFAVDIGEFGTGWMDEEWLVTATRPGFQTVQSKIRLPYDPADRHLLIIMVPGLSVEPERPEELMEQYERFR